MVRGKDAKSLNKLKIIFFSDNVKIILSDDNSVFFEINEFITKDVAEAVSLLMRDSSSNSLIWDMGINIDYDSIVYRNCLYWLSGGDVEWIKLNNYKKPWKECYNEFEEEFTPVINSILCKSKTLEDIKNGFIDNLNLPILYEFALEKDLA
jgi:hypothetical protein